MPPLRVVGGTEKGAEEEVRKKRRWEERPRELREGEEEQAPVSSAGKTNPPPVCLNDFLN